MPKIPRPGKGDIERIVGESKRKPKGVNEIYQAIRREFDQIYEREHELGDLVRKESRRLEAEYEKLGFPTREMIDGLKTLIERGQLVLERVEVHKNKIEEFLSTHKQDLDRRTIDLLKAMIQRHDKRKIGFNKKDITEIWNLVRKWESEIP